MKLSEAVSKITGNEQQFIVLLRHSNSRMDLLTSLGGSVENYTLIQPTTSRYDFRPYKALCVVVYDKVHSIYLIEGIEKEGMTWDLIDKGNLEMDKINHKGSRPAVRYKATRLHNFPIDGMEVIGWKSAGIQPVAKMGDLLFDSLKVDIPEGFKLQRMVYSVDKTDLDQDYRNEILEWLDGKEQQDSVAQILGITARFIRDKSIVEKRLSLAQGVCELCKRYTDDKDVSLPYSLEVHHIIPLSGGGQDHLQNTAALCPNCHRRIHLQNRQADVDALLAIRREDGSTAQ